jgi:hypothetical protein
VAVTVIVTVAADCDCDCIVKLWIVIVAGMECACGCGYGYGDRFAAVWVPAHLNSQRTRAQTSWIAVYRQERPEEEITTSASIAWRKEKEGGWEGGGVIMVWLVRIRQDDVRMPGSLSSR